MVFSGNKFRRRNPNQKSCSWKGLSMPEMQILDSILPFKCQNQDCAKEYDIHEFGDVVLLWGFIFLIAEEDEMALIGITCPECKKTTIQKYRAYAAMKFLWNVSKHFNLIFGDEPIDSKWKIKYFSHHHLLDAGFINTPLPATPQSNETVYFIPEKMIFEDYSKSLQESWPFSISEGTVSYALEIENSQSYKAIPRVLPMFKDVPICINGKDVYLDTDYLLLDQSYEAVNTVLKHLIEPNVWLYDDEAFCEHADGLPLKKMPEEEKLSLMGKNDLLIEEYLDFSISHLSWKRKSFQQNIEDFLNDLKAIRNRLDFELIFRTKLINRYGRIFYHKTKTLEEQRYEIENNRVASNIWKSNPFFGDISKWGYPPLAKTLEIPFRWIHGPELMEKWGLDAFGIINLIQNYELIAYDIINSKHINSTTSFPPDLMNLLTNGGDIEQQKKAMQRLCFHPDNIASFEDYYGERLALKKMDPENTSHPSQVIEENENEFQVSDDELQPEPKDEKSRVKAMRCCQIRAKQLWAKHPNLTINAVADHKAIMDCFKETGYQFDGYRTRHEWVKDCAPKKKTVGRPKGS